MEKGLHTRIDMICAMCSISCVMSMMCICGLGTLHAAEVDA